MSREFSMLIVSFSTYVSQRARQWQEHGLGATPAGLQSLEEWALRSGELARSLDHLHEHETFARDSDHPRPCEQLQAAAGEIESLTLTLRNNLERLSGTGATPPAGFEATIRCLEQLRHIMTELHRRLPRASNPGDNPATGVLADAC